MSKQGKEFNDILDRCLERVLTGESIEACLSDYPQHASELEPLLRTAASVKKATSAVSPSAAFRAGARREFVATLRETKQREAGVPGWAFWRTRWVAVPLGAVCLVLVGGGTVAAANNSLPDQPLYPVKIATEKAMLKLPRSKMDQAELYATLADRRVHEIIVMADKGNVEQVQRVTEEFNSYLAEISTLTATQAAAVPAAAPRAAAPEPATASPKIMAPAAPPPAAAPQTGVSQAPQAAAVPPPSVAAAVPRPSPAPNASGGAGAAGKAQERKDSTTPAKASPKSEVARSVDREKLKEALTRRAMENSAALRAALRKAPPTARPALQKAIDIADERYREALQNLDQPENGH